MITSGLGVNINTGAWLNVEDTLSTRPLTYKASFPLANMDQLELSASVFWELSQGEMEGFFSTRMSHLTDSVKNQVVRKCRPMFLVSTT